MGGKKIYVAGHLGMVGSAIVRRLNKGGYDDLLIRNHDEIMQLSTLVKILDENENYFMEVKITPLNEEGENNTMLQFIDVTNSI